MAKPKIVKKGGVKKIKKEGFQKKEWKHVIVPSVFEKQDVGFTLHSKPARGKQVMDYMNERCFEIPSGDMKEILQGKSQNIFKFRAIGNSVGGINTQFAGMRVANDVLQSNLRKYTTLIKSDVECKSQDGYILRLFIMGFTKKVEHHKHTYAHQADRRNVREIMATVIKELVEKSNISTIITNIENGLFVTRVSEHAKESCPLENVLLYKVKCLVAPKPTDAERDASIIEKAKPTPVEPAKEVKAKGKAEGK